MGRKKRILCIDIHDNGKIEFTRMPGNVMTTYQARKLSKATGNRLEDLAYKFHTTFAIVPKGLSFVTVYNRSKS